MWICSNNLSNLLKLWLLTNSIKCWHVWGWGWVRCWGRCSSCLGATRLCCRCWCLLIRKSRWAQNTSTYLSSKMFWNSIHKIFNCSVWIAKSSTKSSYHLISGKSHNSDIIDLKLIFNHKIFEISYQFIRKRIRWWSSRSCWGCGWCSCCWCCRSWCCCWSTLRCWCCCWSCYWCRCCFCCCCTELSLWI